MTLYSAFHGTLSSIRIFKKSIVSQLLDAAKGLIIPVFWKKVTDTYHRTLGETSNKKKYHGHGCKLLAID